MAKKHHPQRNLEDQEAFIAAFIKRKGNISRACELCKIPRSTVYVWRDKDAKFADAFDQAMKQIEEDLFEQVFGYAYAENLTAAIFALKALNREKYDDAVAKLKWLRDNEMQDPDAPKETNIVFVREAGPHEVVEATDEPVEH